MTYVTDERVERVYMITRTGTLKWGYVEKNPRVSLLVDTRLVAEERGSCSALTVDGLCRPVRDADERRYAVERLLGRNPRLEELIRHGDVEVLAVSAESFLLLEGVGAAYRHRV